MFSNFGAADRRERSATLQERQAVDAALQAHQAAPSMDTLIAVVRLVRALYDDGVTISRLTRLFNESWGTIERSIDGLPMGGAFLTPKPKPRTSLDILAARKEPPRG